MLSRIEAGEGVVEKIEESALLAERWKWDWYLADGLQSESRPSDAMATLVGPASYFWSLECVEYPSRFNPLAESDSDAVSLNNGRSERVGREASSW